MPKRISFYVLFIVFWGVFFNHVSFQKKENGYLLILDGREVDAIGIAKDEWLEATRNCAQVHTVKPTAQQYLDIKRLIQTYSPPNSESAEIVGLLTTGMWFLVEVKFKELLPAVVLIQQTDLGLQIVPNAIWSGTTHPWRAAPFIRRYLFSKAPTVPEALLECFDPQASLH